VHACIGRDSTDWSFVQGDCGGDVDGIKVGIYMVFFSLWGILDFKEVALWGIGTGGIYKLRLFDIARIIGSRMVFS